MGKTLRNIVGGILIGAAALLSTGDKADAGRIQINSNFNGVAHPPVALYHDSEEGITDLYDGCDSIYQEQNFPAPAIDFYSTVSISETDPTPLKLSEDFRSLTSTSTYNTEIRGRGLTGSIAGNLTFIVSGAGDFGSLPIFADIYKNGSLEYGNIDVRNYWSNNTSVPLTLGNNSDFYNINVRFIPEPATDFNLDGIVNFKDFAYFAPYWQTFGHDANDFWANGTDLNKDGYVDANDLGQFANEWLWGIPLEE